MSDILDNTTLAEILGVDFCRAAAEIRVLLSNGTNSAFEIAKALIFFVLEARDKLQPTKEQPNDITLREIIKQHLESVMFDKGCDPEPLLNDLQPYLRTPGQESNLQPSDAVLVELMLPPMLKAFYQNINWDDDTFRHNEFWKPEVDRVRAAIPSALRAIRHYPSVPKRESGNYAKALAEIWKDSQRSAIPFDTRNAPERSMSSYAIEANAILERCLALACRASNEIEGGN